MTPSGVEHYAEVTGVDRNSLVDQSVTPSGVEHSCHDLERFDDGGVDQSVTPSGVEHPPSASASIKHQVSGPISDAFGR